MAHLVESKQERIEKINELRDIAEKVGLKIIKTRYGKVSMVNPLKYSGKIIRCNIGV